MALIQTNSGRITTRTVPKQELNPLKNILKERSVFEKALEQGVKL